MKRFFSYIKIIRPLNCVITALVVIVGGVISSTDYSIDSLLVLASLVAALTAASGNVINDLFDIEIDKIVHPNRPLAKGELEIIEVRIFYVLLIITASAITFNLNYLLFVVTVLAILILFFYSAYIKKIPLLGNVVVALLTALAFLFGGIAVNNISGAVLPAIFAFLINLIRELVKDAEDIEGDKKNNVITFPIKFGIQRTKQLVMVLTFILVGFTVYPFAERIYEIEYFVIVMIIVNPVLVYSVKSLFTDNERKNYHRISSLLKLDMIFGLIAIFLGK
ncbi:geranylgeranylglycerol-phosphate geranylgeranyltransferase [Ignavibacterium sp.]|uniref:geranylgeranylglycerol-phosphate geranylgeranyltransferase n=1 Tax=Ignavibacterium sp. TaxID=2651167 RepID=UPI00307D6E55